MIIFPILKVKSIEKNDIITRVSFFALFCSFFAGMFFALDN